LIETMKYINIMGPVDDVDRVIERYVSRYDIQLERTARELPNEKGLTELTGPNPYARALAEADEMAGLLPPAPAGAREGARARVPSMGAEEALEVIRRFSEHMGEVSSNLSGLRGRRDGCVSAIAALEPFSELEFDFELIMGFEFIRFAFGRMPTMNFKQFEAFIYEDSEILFVHARTVGDYLYGIYFAPESCMDKVDSIFSSLHFEKTPIPTSVNGEELSGSPSQIIGRLRSELDGLNASIVEADRATMEEAHAGGAGAMGAARFEEAREALRRLHSCHEMRRYAAKTPNDFYIMVGWTTESSARRLEAETAGDDRLVLISEGANVSILSKPPTKLRTLRFFRPFEFFVRMYGLPSYDEIDPTAFVAVTYSILFGMMFADVGQGAVLMLAGLAIYLLRRARTALIACVVGFHSMAFGFVFGSFFGMEFDGLWLHPAEPDSIDTILLYSVGIGAFIIIVSIAFNIANSLRKRAFKDMLLHPNGLAGVIFYGALVTIVLLTAYGSPGTAGKVALAFVVLPMALMSFREPIGKLISGRRDIYKGSFGLFLFETLIGAFEVTLGYFSNTVSFVRVGAFALSHASMMHVVFMLSRGAGGGSNPVTVVLGNVLVMALEGLLVAIQVLRLEFYEMFGRFYEGGGREFKPVEY